MTTKYAKSAFRAFLRRNYERFAELQEKKKKKNERELIEIMGDENDAQYPIPQTCTGAGLYAMIFSAFPVVCPPSSTKMSILSSYITRAACSGDSPRRFRQASTRCANAPLKESSMPVI